MFCGCPPGDWRGRYVVVNNTESAITGLTLSAGNDSEKSWNETLPGQGWIHSRSLGHGLLTISWKDESGDHEERFSFDKKVGYGSRADLFIELKPHGLLEWRIVEPPKDKSNLWAVVPVYVLWCLSIGLVLGVPVALAAVIAYVLFSFIRQGLIATVEGLRGDRSVFQFTIREIALLTAVVALACGWFVQFVALKH
jgi:hypothetical protein